MPVEIILPKVDMDMATGRISRWFVAEGAVVKKGDVLFEIETDKAAMEIDAPTGGVVRDVTGREGVDIPVGEVVAWIYAEGEEQAGKGGDAFSKAETAKNEAPISPRVGEMSAKQTEGGAVQPASQNSGNGKAVQGSGATTPPSGLPAAGASHGSRPSFGPPTRGEIMPNGSVRASPLARRLARESDIDIAVISGSGPHGRVVKTDVETVIAGRGVISPRVGEMAGRAEGGAVPQTSSAKSDAVTLKLFAEGSYELIPHDTMRKTIARRLVEAKTTIPHFYLTLDCELDALLALRSQLNAASPMKKTDKGEVPAYKLSVNDMVIKAMALALRDVPTANVSWTETAMVQHKAVDVGVAVSIPGGLITPIIRQADTKTLSAISNEMKDLAARARNKKLKPEEYQGGTTAVSNLGMFGVKDFAAVINPPHATILAVGAGEERAVVKKGEIRIATIMSVTLSTDHRAVDGALGAELMVAFKRHIENPLGMLV